MLRSAIGKTLGVILAAGMLVLAGGAAADAASRWSDTASPLSVYSDHKAHYVGDVVTIIISEATSSSHVGQTANSKTANTNMNAGVGLFTFLDNASAGQSDSFTAKGSISNINNVNGRITAQVTGVMPNGDLMLTGTRTVRQNGDEQKITLTGTVRPDDIAADNTVLSSYIANAEIKIDGKGPIYQKQHQGIITRIFDWLF